MATVTSWSSTSIVAPVPTGATTGNVTVTVGGQTSNGMIFTIAASPPPGAITHLQQASNSDISGVAQSSFSATFASPTTSGNAILVGVTFGNNSTVTVTDTQGNTYTQAINTYDSRRNQASAIFYATNITGSSLNTVTVNFSAAAAYLALGIHEYTGIAASSALDGTTGNLGNGTGPSSGSATTTANGDLIFGCVVEDSVGNGDTFAAGSGFTKLVDLGTAAAYADESQVQPSAASIAVTFTLSPSGLDWIAAMAAFKASTDGGARPAITSLSPTSGAAGSSVTITGTNFGTAQGSSTVTFNGTSATPTSWSATSIVAPVPSGAATGNVVVTVAGLASNAVSFIVSPIRHVQQASNGDESGATYSTFSATFGSATTTGNAIILGLSYGIQNPTITVTDSQGNAYTQAIATYDSGHSQGCAVFYATGITGGSTNTVTAHFGATVGYLALGIHEYTGIATSLALDVASGQTGTYADLSSGSATTAANGDLIFSCGVEDSNSGGDTFTAGSGFTKRVDLGMSFAYADEDRIQASAGPIAATWTLSPDFLGWITVMAAFKAAVP